MPKKDQDFAKELKDAQQQGNVKPSQIKKSRSAEDLTPKSPASKEIQELQDQVKFEAQKSQNYLGQITKLTAELDTQGQTIKELSKTNQQLTDHNQKLRLTKLQLSDCQKELTKTQQDLKTAQRIIELRLPTNNKNKSRIDY
jgi:hypothetical protein